MRPARRLWIDCDPGHDDAFALVLAFFSPSLTVLGVSTTAGNQTLDKTTLNARRMLAALKQRVRVVKGVARPLLALPRACPEIHGLTGLDLPASASCDALRTRFVALCDEQTEKEKDDATNGLLVIREALLREAVDSVDFVATGCLTNVALLLAAFPEVKNRIRQLTFLGGAVGSPPGNIAPAAEFNVLLDPHAAQMVFHSGVKVVQIPLSVTHTALFGPAILAQMPGAHEGELAQLFRGFVEFFSESYRTVFRIPEPPLHDPLAVCFVLAEELFGKRLVNVEVETGSFFCFGQTVADLDCVSGRAPNVWLVESVDASAFWRLMLAACRAAVDHVGSTI